MRVVCLWCSKARYVRKEKDGRKKKNKIKEKVDETRIERATFRKLAINCLIHAKRTPYP